MLPLRGHGWRHHEVIPKISILSSDGILSLSLPTGHDRFSMCFCLHYKLTMVTRVTFVVPPPPGCNILANRLANQLYGKEFLTKNEPYVSFTETQRGNLISLKMFPFHRKFPRKGPNWITAFPGGGVRFSSDLANQLYVKELLSSYIEPTLCLLYRNQERQLNFPENVSF